MQSQLAVSRVASSVEKMEKERAKRISKFMSLVLRHEPSAAGLTLDDPGWVAVDDLIAGAARRGVSFTRAELDEVVGPSDKQRFALSSDGQRIRANQGQASQWNSA